MTGGADGNERCCGIPIPALMWPSCMAVWCARRTAGVVVMLATLYYEPLWIFYRDTVVHEQFDELRHRRLAVGSADSGVRAFMEPLARGE